LVVSNNILFQQDLYNNAPCGYFTLNKKLELTSVNKTLAEWLLYEPETLISEGFDAIVSLGTQLYFETHVIPIIGLKGSVTEVSLNLIKNNNQSIPVLLNAIKRTDGSIDFTVFDITQRKKYERDLLIAKKQAEEYASRLVNTNKELEKFAQVVSHDLKSPLNNISHLVHLFNNEYKSSLDENGLEYLGYISNSVDTLRNLINGILNYYNSNVIENSEREEIELATFFEELLIVLNPEDEYNITYPLQGTISFYKPLLSQLFINLISNAIKYNKSEVVKVDIGFSETKNYYVFTVEDNGIGILEKNIESVFGFLTTLGEKDRFGKKGSGIGLSTVKKIIDNFDGVIDIKSVINKGTKISFSICKSSNKYNLNLTK